MSLCRPHIERTAAPHDALGVGEGVVKEIVELLIGHLVVLDGCLYSCAFVHLIEVIVLAGVVHIIRWVGEPQVSLFALHQFCHVFRFGAVAA